MVKMNNCVGGTVHERSFELLFLFGNNSPLAAALKKDF